MGRIIAVNVKSAFMLARRVLPLMLTRGGGSIVLMCSVSAPRGFPYKKI